MFESQPQSPFLKHVPQNEQTFFTKKIASMLQTDKQNIVVEKPQIRIDKMQIGQNQIDGYLVEVGEMVKLKKEIIRDIFKGLQKENKSKRIIIGLLGHRPQPVSKGKQALFQKSSSTQKVPTLLNLNILAKFKPQEYPYISMFTCDCLMSILKMYAQKSGLKEQDLRMRWKNNFLVEDEKIGEILVINDHKGEDVFSNIAIRMKLSRITSDQQALSRDLLEQFASRLNISRNLRQSAIKIRQLYESHLILIGEDVTIKTRQPNQWEDIVSGKFVRVNEIGNAILESAEGDQQEFENGLMELKKQTEQIQQQQDEEDRNLAEIGF